MPELLRSAKLAVEKGQSQGRNESYVKQLSDYIIPALIEALHKVNFVIFPLLISGCFHYILNFCLQEPETEICASMLDAINECVQVCINYFSTYIDVLIRSYS